jgi:putative membrane protein
VNHAPAHLHWTFSIPILIPIGVYAYIYLRRFREVRRSSGKRGASARHLWAFVGSIVVILVALISPLDGLGEDYLFSAHMVQHLLLGDIGPLLVVLGLAGTWRRAHPAAVLPLWAAVSIGWHVPALYDAALAHAWLHELQHLSFLAAGVLLWSALLLPGPAWFSAAWRLPYVLGMWAVSLGLSQVFIWSGHAYYHGYTLDDQRAGGGVMLVESSFVMLGVVVWLLLRVFAESESHQRVLEG